VSSEPLLALDGVAKRFGGLTVLHNVSFTIGSGEILGLVGPNGSGKTTTINVISGIHQVDAGTMRFEGRSIEHVPSFRLAHLGINRTFQVPKPFPEMTARENIEVAAYFGAGSRNAPARPVRSLANSPSTNRSASISGARSRCGRSCCSWMKSAPGSTRANSP